MKRLYVTKLLCVCYCSFTQEHMNALYLCHMKGVSRFITLMSMLSLSLYAQIDNRALGYFTVDAGSQSVLISWELNAGFTCTGITIERRADDESDFITVGVIKGLCGSPTQSISYAFTDTTVKQNRSYHYRLILGAEGHTMQRRVFVRALNAERLRVYPNPASREINVNLHNPPSASIQVVIASVGGEVLHNAAWNVREDLSIDVSRLPSGRYYVYLRGEGVDETSAVIVQQP